MVGKNFNPTRFAQSVVFNVPTKTIIYSKTTKMAVGDDMAFTVVHYYTNNIHSMFKKC